MSPPGRTPDIGGTSGVQCHAPVYISSDLQEPADMAGGSCCLEDSTNEMAIRDNFVTPYVKANGFGGVDMDRLAKSIDQVGITYDFKNKPKADDIFTSKYLPPASERKL